MGKFRGPNTLERWPTEKILVHRAMLLYGMQHPDAVQSALTRSFRAVGRAINTPDATVRDWSKGHRWDERIKSVPDEESACVALYRSLYMDEHGATELPAIASRVIVPLLARSGVSQDSAADEVITRARQMSTATVRAEQAIAATVADRRRAERGKVEQFRGLVEAALGETARLLKAGKLRVTAKDIPSLLGARRELSEWLESRDDRVADGRAAPESARVRHAKDTGGDLLDAVWQDMEEIRTILGVLRTRRDVGSDGASDFVEAPAG
jgi:hypothetical protein